MKALYLNCCPQGLAQALAAELRRRRYTVALLDETEQALVRLSFDPSRGGTLTFSTPRSLEQLRPFLQEDFLLSLLNLPGLPDLSPDTADGPLTALHLRPGEPVGELADRVLETVPDLLPFPSGNPCCRACEAGSCQALLEQILSGQATKDACGLAQEQVVVEVNGVGIPMVGFVQRIFRETNLGILRLLEGYSPHSEVVIRIRQEDV